MEIDYINDVLRPYLESKGITYEEFMNHMRKKAIKELYMKEFGPENSPERQ